MVCGIYMIINKQTGQKYVGQSVDIDKRWKEHLRGKNLGHSYIDNSIKKYRKDNFTLQIITELPNNQKMLNEHEKYWIKFYNTYIDEDNYNLTPGGDFNPMYLENVIKKHHKSIIGKKHYNARGIKNPNAKYTLWDSHCVSYIVGNMFHGNREPNPCKCFYLSYDGKKVNIGGFVDFLSCKIIHDLIKKLII